MHGWQTQLAVTRKTCFPELSLSHCSFWDQDIQFNLENKDRSRTVHMNTATIKKDPKFISLLLNAKSWNLQQNLRQIVGKTQKTQHKAHSSKCKITAKAVNTKNILPASNRNSNCSWHQLMWTCPDGSPQIWVLMRTMIPHTNQQVVQRLIRHIIRLGRENRVNPKQMWK